MAAITIREIAKRLGVSETAVSFAINNQPGISDETRSRILDEIKKLNYKPRKAKRKKNNVALVLSMKLNPDSDSPILSTILNIIYKEADKANYQINIIYSPSSGMNSETDLNKYDGLIVLGTAMQQQDIDQYIKMGKPLVVMDNSFRNLPINTVSIDNSGGIESAVQYLKENGHTRIGYIRSVLNLKNFIERYRKFECIAVKDQIDIKDVISLGMTPAGAYEEMRGWLKDNRLSATALLVDNDYIALGAIRAIREAGLTPGKDVSIIGFDDLQYSQISDPPLTTVRIYGEQLGTTSFKRLLEVIQNPEQPHSHILIGTKLIVRDSVLNIVTKNE